MILELELYAAGVVKDTAVDGSCSRCRMRKNVWSGGEGFVSSGVGVVADYWRIFEIGRGEALRLAACVLARTFRLARPIWQ